MRIFLIIISICIHTQLYGFSHTTSNEILSSKTVKILCMIMSSETQTAIPFAKIYFFDDLQKVMRSDSNGIFQKIIVCRKDSIALRIQANGYESIIATIACSEEKQMIMLQTKKMQVKDIIVNAEKNSLISANKVESIQESAIYEAKKTELIIPDLLNPNKAVMLARQLFSRVPGLNIWESDQAGLQLGIGGRGLSPNRTAHFNTRMNGYDIAADPLGYPESYFTPPIEAIERIEIVRGAASLQYGPQFGGMINFKMKKGIDSVPLHGEFRMNGGSFGLMGMSALVGGESKGLNYIGFYSYKQGNGWRPNSDFSAHTVYSSISSNISEHLTLTFDVTNHHSLSQQPGGLTDRQFQVDPSQSSRSRNWFLIDWQIYALNILYEISPITRIHSRTFSVIAQRSSVGNLQNISVLDNGKERTLIDGVFANIGNETRLMHTIFINDIPANIVLGARIYQGYSVQKQGFGSKGSDADFTYLDQDNPDQLLYKNPGKNIAGFLECVIRPTENWSIVPGIRVEYIATYANGWYKDRIVDLAGNLVQSSTYNEQKSNLRSFGLFGLGTSYVFDNGLELYANYAQNYRAMTFSDMRIVNPNFIVDTNLSDEKGFNADLGIRGSLFNGLFYSDISCFYLEYDKRIGTILAADKAPYYIPYRLRTNIGSSRTIGIEAIVETDIWKLWIDDDSRSVKAFINVSYLDGIYTSSLLTGIKGKQVEQVSPFTLRTGLQYEQDKLKASIQYSYVYKQYSDATNAEYTSNAVIGLIPSYSIMDISLSYKLLQSLIVDMHIQNVCNESYFTRRAESYPGPGILPSDPRNITCSIQYSL